MRHASRPTRVGLIVATMAVGFLAAATGAHAGANRWTRIGPEGGDVSALAIDPLTSTTLYAKGP